jgi:hypothetical protein
MPGTGLAPVAQRTIVPSPAHDAGPPDVDVVLDSSDVVLVVPLSPLSGPALVIDADADSPADDASALAPVLVPLAPPVAPSLAVSPRLCDAVQPTAAAKKPSHNA